MLALYIGVLCHEFGMFPLGKKSFDKYSYRGLEATRKRHALTSFQTLADPDGRDTDLNDELRDIIRRLKNVSSHALAMAALISAYHSRFLSLEHFANLENDASGIDKIRRQGLNCEKVNKQLIDTAKCLPSESLVVAQQLSAIFRFADAIEMDRSRVPAPFLLEAEGRADMQNREDLKRQVVERVTIEDGEVSIQFNCPSADLKADITWPWPSNAQIKTDSLSEIVTINVVFDLLRDLFPSFEKQSAADTIKAIKSKLDNWLDNPQGKRNESSIAFVAALSVICDVVDEYNAIKIVGQNLARVLKLGRVQWGETLDLVKMSLLKVVMARQKSLLETHRDQANELYEFKFVFQSRHFAQDLLKLIGRKESFDYYSVVSRSRQTIKDVYYDVWLNGAQCFALAAKGASCRWRVTDDVDAFQVKETQQVSGDYRKFTTRSFPVEARDENGRPARVPSLVQSQFGEHLFKSLLPVAGIENERCTLVVVRGTSGKWAKLNLDTFYITDRCEKPLEDCEEIEIVSPDATVVADLSEILAASFKLFKTQKSRIERFSQALSLSAQDSKRELLWLDVDTGVDDAMGLLLALRAPESCAVIGVSAVGGNVSLEQVLTNTAKIVFFSGVFPKPPLFKGFAPLGSKPDASNVHGKNGIGEIDDFVPDFVMPEWADLTAGFERLVAQHEKGEITFVATGPLTNLAKLTQDCPESVKQLKAIVIMGGAFDEPGNRAAKAEFNIHSDPESAVSVLAFCQENGIRHYFVPLDITHQAVLQRGLVNDPVHERNRDVQFIKALSAHYMHFYDKNQAMDGCPLHDPMAVGFALWPELFTSDNFHVEIASSGMGAFSGATSADSRPTRLYRNLEKQVSGVVLQVDREEFLKRFQEKVLRINTEKWGTPCK